MKRITVSLPDDLVDKVKTAAGDGGVSAYVAKALIESFEPKSLDELLALWNLETPVPDEIRRQVEAEFDGLGMFDPSTRNNRLVG